jgi:hypothetical protein
MEDLATQFKKASSDLKIALDESDQEVMDYVSEIVQKSIESMIVEQCKADIERLSRENAELRKDIEYLKNLNSNVLP